MEAGGRKKEVCRWCICGEMAQFIVVSWNGSSRKEHWTYWFSTNGQGCNKSVFCLCFLVEWLLSLWCFISCSNNALSIDRIVPIQSVRKPDVRKVPLVYNTINFTESSQTGSGSADGGGNRLISDYLKNTN